jgi:hypothetical protein
MVEGSYNPADTTSDQSPEDQAVVKKVLRLYDISKKAKEKKQQVWRDHWEFFLGRQWPSSRPTYRASEVLNYTFAAIQSALPILTDNRPRFSFLPEDPGDTEFAAFLEKITDSDWQREGWNNVVVELYLAGMIYGTSIGALKWDPEANGGLGRIRFVSVDPFQFFPAPSAMDINDGSCPWILEVKPISLAKAKSMFPEFASKFQCDVTPDIPSKYTKESIETTDAARIINFPQPKNDPYFAFGSTEQKGDQVLVYECWMDDDTMDEVELQETDELGRPLYVIGEKPAMQKGSKKRYPNGRHIIVINNVKVYDENSEYDDGLYPYAKYLDYQLPNEFWGLGECDVLKSPQRIINRTISAAMDNMTIMGNPLWIVDQGAVDAELLTNAPGLIIEKTPGTDVHREPGIPLPASVTSLYELALGSFDRIFGSNEISMGVRPTGITAGVAIDSLQEAAQTRLRLKARNMEKTLNELGALYLSRIMQYYTTARWVTFQQEGAPPEAFQFQIQKDPEATGWYVASLRRGKIGDNGKVILTDEQKRFKTKGIFDVRSSVGSNLPFAKKTKTDKATQLFQLGVIDDEELLKAIEWPNWERVLQRVHDKQAAAAQAQAQAAPVAQKK